MTAPIVKQASIEPQDANAERWRAVQDANAERWRAVLERDRRFDGAFVYAVHSTGIYCRPSCPSRRPRAEQVVFFPLPEAAERAGFRPCRRCQPRSVEARDPRAQLVERVCRYIDANLESRLTLAELGAHAGLSAHHLERTFARLLGITPRQYADARRMGLFKARLRGGKNVTDALYEAGFGSSSRIYERADAQLGMTPATYRRGGKGMRVSFATVPCPLGRLLVGATERGICAVSLGDSDGELEAALLREYPNAEINRDQGAIKRWVEGVLQIAFPSLRTRHSALRTRHSALRTPELPLFAFPSLGTPHSALRTPELPLDVRATAFQWRVWEALRAIPRGGTRSYGDIARAIGRPGAARAVAQACASNPVALLIPCHRAVRGDGGSGGYRWGSARKKKLLELEHLP